MKVYHIYARNKNFGDHALGLATRNLFREYFDPECIFETIDTHQYWIEGKELDRLNSNSDLVLVGGGGLIHTFDLDGRTWMFHLPTKLVHQINRPLVVFAVGFNQFRDETEWLHSSVIDNLYAIRKHALSFSVRNDRSGEMLGQNGIIADVIPDPGFFLDGDYPIPGDVARPYAVVQLAYDAAKSRGIDGAWLINNMVNVVDYIVDSGYSVVIAPHCKPDIEISRNIQSSVLRQDRVIVWDYYASISDDLIRQSLGYYKFATFVIAMRGHSQIIPWGMGVPFITIANHRKHTDLLNGSSLAEYVIDIHELTASLVIQKIECLLANRGNLVDELKTRVISMRSQMAQYMGNIRHQFLCNVRKSPDLSTKLDVKLRKLCASYRSWMYYR